jgi:gluconate 2-dehydrogenase subunit 3-like protein
MTRRELVQITAAAAVPAARTPKFFSREELAMVDELSELIIPADNHSPGARAAQVASYIDGRLAESIEDEPKKRWREGLSGIDALSRKMHGKPFLETAPAQRLALIAQIAKNEREPKTPDEHFFKELKSRTARAYYTSNIGIHQEMEYKGNVALQEFLGEQVLDQRDL